MKRRLAAVIIGTSILLSGCSTAPAAGPPSGSTTTAPSPDPTPTPLPKPPPEPARPSGWLAQVTGDAGRLAILGDSFAAGEGAGDYQPAIPGRGDSCHRSLSPAAAELFAPENTANLACSRATTGHLAAPQSLARKDETDAATVPAQLEQLRGFDPTLVVLSVGGNNLDFAGILQACLLEATPCSDNPRLGAHAEAELASLLPDLVYSYDQVAAAVSVPVLVLPYPQLFDEPDGGCGRLSVEEQRFGQDLIRSLNAVIRSAVESSSASNVYYVDAVENALAGHGACSPEPFVHAADVSGLLQAADSLTANQELLHPTYEGYRAMTRELVRWAAGHPAPQ